MATQAGRILIVDDEVSLLTVMQQYLQRLDYDVVACRSGAEAWKAFEPDPLSFALVLADVVMPDMSGRELLERMLQLNPGIAILVCSGYPFDPASVPEAARDRVGFLQKPFAPRMLADSVAQLIAGRGPAPQEA